MGVFYKDVSPCQMKNRDPCHHNQVINEKLWLKADHEQWALSLALQGDASGHFNDARMYQVR